MNYVYVSGQGNLEGICELANELQEEYKFSTSDLAGSIPLKFTRFYSESPFECSLMDGVCVFTRESDGIAAYAGIEQNLYLLSWAFLGLLQWRTLMLNPNIRQVDLLHPDQSSCLFSGRSFIEDYALAFENPHLCPSCKRFYGALAPQDMECISKLLKHISENVSQYPLYRIEPLEMVHEDPEECSEEYQ